MQAITIAIEGEYYDSQIYSGRLYLWTSSSDIIILDWNRLVNDLITSKDTEIAMHCAFLNSDYLYGNQWRLFFQDSDIKNVIQRKLLDIAGRRFEVKTSSLRKYTTSTKHNNFPFPHADSDIYYGNIIVASRSGLSHSRIAKQAIEQVDFLTDIPCTSLSPHNYIIAVSCGDQGLYEINPLHNINKLEGIGDLNFRNSKTKQISNIDSNKSEWMYQSVFSASNDGSAEITKYDLLPRGKNITEAEKIDYYKNREILEHFAISEGLLSHNSASIKPQISWGVKDKICSISESELTVHKYLPWLPKSDQLKFIASFSTDIRLGEVVSGNSTNFGYLIERDDGIEVLQSSGERDVLVGEPTNWRCFNRSKNYTNHLHVAYPDRIEIHSYNDDYFMDWQDRIIGLDIENTIKDTKAYKNMNL